MELVSWNLVGSYPIFSTCWGFKSCLEEIFGNYGRSLDPVVY